MFCICTQHDRDCSTNTYARGSPISCSWRCDRENLAHYTTRKQSRGNRKPWGCFVSLTSCHYSHDWAPFGSTPRRSNENCQSLGSQHLHTPTEVDISYVNDGCGLEIGLRKNSLTPLHCHCR
eukprot:PhF_6_TR6879/c0_g1_i1/m.9900